MKGVLLALLPEEAFIGLMLVVLGIMSFVSLAGCDPTPPIKCDYCHVLRSSVTRFFCDKCKGSHVSCSVDEKLMHFEEHTSLRGGPIQVPVYVTVCPTPEDPARTEHVEVPEKYRTRSPGELAVTSVIMVLLFFIGYAKGRTDQRKQPTGKSK